MDGASSAHPAWALAAGAVAGPLMTLAIVAACCALVARNGPSAIVIAAGLLAPFRVFVPVFWLVTHTLWNRGNGANFDELNAARTIGWPAQPFILIEAAAIIVAVWWLVRAIPRPERWPKVLFSLIGGVVGIAAYWTLAPHLLP